ncbi:MAG: hypothetical protein A3F73_09895 [Gallionellales bacterium RIFCSPLOWO2_12_FULL_59_22]|nr:MAG: hypothetical protein A3H99_02770 [Gallionellales bacterium RIFCSPLOWO2_02_FULL_59_110]OGT14433.1 MAG: hypothetical protein A3F73_09895 [Gallionellales bacterium RIFCSPLOWO2_12_FULL_59_22]
MKIVFVFGTVILLSSMISACNKSGISAGASIVGVWDCNTMSEDGPQNSNVPDTKTFSADGQYSSSKAPEGKKYKYSLEGDKLTISFTQRDWIEKITRLTKDSLEYYNDMSGKPVKASCKKSKEHGK